MKLANEQNSTVRRIERLSRLRINFYVLSASLKSINNITSKKERSKYQQLDGHIVFNGVIVVVIVTVSDTNQT